MLHARDKWLRPGGAVLPDIATIHIAGVSAAALGLDFWNVSVWGHAVASHACGLIWLCMEACCAVQLHNALVRACGRVLCGTGAELALAVGLVLYMLFVWFPHTSAYGQSSTLCLGMFTCCFFWCLDTIIAITL